MATLSPGLPTYNSNPAPQAGNGAYGAVPGPISIPSNIFQQVNAAVPGAAGNANQASSVIGNQLSGNLLQDKSAAYGVNIGQPGGTPGNSLSLQNFLDSIGLTSENLANQGVGNYLSFLSGVGATQTSPNLAVDVATQNAVDAAAPNPTAAAAQEQSLFDKYLAKLQNPAGGTAKPQTQFQKATAEGGGNAFLRAGSNTWQPGNLLAYSAI
jgi:hypothetical protein